MKYVFQNCRVIDGTGGTPLENACVWVDGSTIRKITGPGIVPPAGYETLDLGGRYVLPGLINLHAHLFGTGRPSKSMGGGKEQERIVRFASTRAGGAVLRTMIRGNLKTMLHSGVTTVRGVGDLFYSDIAVRDQLAAGRGSGPRTLVSGPAVTVPGGHGDGTFAVIGSTPEELRRRTEEVCAHGPDLIKTCVTGGVMDARKEGEPGELKMDLAQTRAVCGAAHAHGLKVAAHVESSEGVRVALKAGVDTIEHGAVLDEGLIALFLEKGAALVCTLSPALPLSKLDASVTKLSRIAQVNARVVADGVIAGAKAAIAAGIPVGLGTDASCPFVSQYNMWAELYWFAKYVGVSSAEAIRAATLVNARILGIDGETGSLEAGKRADLIVTAANPLEDLRALREVELVMCGGRLVRHPRVKKIPQIEEQIDRLL